jgi:MraZ protein
MELGVGVADPRFIDRFTNKIDRKGRVSVPATFRSTLAGQSFLGIICYKSFKLPCIEGIARSSLDGMVERVNHLPEFSEERETLEALFSRMSELAFDGEGRVMLPEHLMIHAGITELAIFVGLGAKFQIWEPERFNARDAELEERARRDGATMPTGLPHAGGMR